MRLALCVLFLAANLAAQTTTAIRARHMLDVRNGKLIDDAVVIVRGHDIVAAGAGLAVPDGATVIELGDATVLPGMIDCHTHLLSSSSGPEYATMLLTKSQAYRALEGAANARKTLLAGFTTVRDVENEGSGYADVDLRNAIRRGLVPGPRMKVATRGIAAVGQYYPFGVSSDLPDFPRGAQMVSGVDEVRRAVRDQIGNGADLIKVYADWDYPTLTIDELRTVVEEAHKAGRKVAAHATTTEGIRNAVTAGVDSIEHGDKADRATLLEMKAKHVWLVPTYSRELAVVDEVPEDARAEVRAYLEKKGESLRLAHELGVSVAVGSDAGETKYHGANAAELRALVSAGFTTAEAIRAATITAAELLGMQERIGTIEPGKAADLIAVRGDVLADIDVLQHVTFVMKDGEVIR